MTDKDIFETVGHLANSIEKIAHGNERPGGLEALAMMTSEAQKENASSLDGIASAIESGSNEIATALSEVADAIQTLALAFKTGKKA